MRPNHRLRRILFQRPLARRAGRAIGLTVLADNSAPAGAKGPEGGIIGVYGGVRGGGRAARALRAAAVGRLICARTIGCGAVFFNARWREGAGGRRQHRRVWRRARGRTRRACFAGGGGRPFDMRPNRRLRRVLFQRPLARGAGRAIGLTVLADNSAPAGAKGPEGGGSIGVYGGVRGGGRAARALRAAAVGHLICARTISGGAVFFSVRWREGPECAAASACMAACAGEDAPRVLCGRRRSAI